jgi:hypothetical protein
MIPKLRTIFYHSSLPGGQKTVKNPAGWKKLLLSLERSETYHTLIESFKSSSLWYGNARETLLSIKASDGANAEIRVTMEGKFSELGSFEIIFDGLIKLAQMEEIFEGIRSNKINAPIIRNGFWSKFHNRYDRPVNLESTTDLDGGTRTAVNKTTVLMRGQTIQKRTFGKRDLTIVPTVLTSKIRIYAQSDYSLDIINEESGEFFSYENISTTDPTTNEFFNIKVSQVSEGQYEAEVSNKVRLRLDPIGLFFNDDTVTWDHVIKLVRLNGTVETRTFNILNAAVIGTVGGSSLYLSAYQTFTQTESFTDLVVGDRIFSYHTWLVTDNAVQAANIDNSIEYDPAYDHYFKTEAQTEFPDTTTDAYLIKEAAQSIISKYVGADSPLISTKFSDSTFNRNAIFRGKHNRGYNFSQKDMSMSMKNWWESADPAFNLCLGYTKVSGVDKIFIEDKAYAYNPTPIVNLPNARNLVRRYDLEKFFSSIECGFSKGQAESASGIDDHQTKRTFNTNLKTFGRDFKNLSQFFCAALAIEQSRRKRVELGKDDRLDEELMMVSVISGSPWTLEFDENFDNVSGLLNPAKRANLRHSATRLFKRWQNVYNPSLRTSESFTFGRGEGNYDPTTRLDPADYEATANPDELVDEKGNRQANGARLWVPEIWELSDYEMDITTYKQIRDNKENAINLSRTSANFAPMFITSFDFELFKGSANMILLQATSAEP